MKIVIAPDSFKECLGAAEVAAIIAGELHVSERAAGRPVCPPGVFAEGLGDPWEILECPLSDGGEGFADILSRHWGAEKVPVVVTGPLGAPVRTWYGKAGETAIMDVASVCGLSLVPVAHRNPLHTTTRGLGELLLAAYRDGCRKALVGLGGSATCDGGAGLLEAEGPLASGFPAVPVRALAGRMEIRALCDVTNPFTGPQGAARVFGPQKGADAAMVETLEERMEEMAGRIRRETGKDVREMPGAGAAGGLAGALAAWFDAELLPGIDSMLSAVGFKDMIDGADLIITGEGKSDCQTLSGKVPLGVLKAARQASCQLPDTQGACRLPVAQTACRLSDVQVSCRLPDAQTACRLPDALGAEDCPDQGYGTRRRPVPVVLLSGVVEDREALLRAGFSRVVQITPPSMPRDMAIRPETAARHLRQAVARADWLYAGGSSKWS